MAGISWDGKLRRDLAPMQVHMLVLAMYAGSMTVAGQQVEPGMHSRQVAHDIGLLFEGIAGRQVGDRLG